MTGNEYSVHKQVTAVKSQIYMNWRIIENWCLLDKASYSDWQEIPQLLNFLTNLEFCMGGWHNLFAWNTDTVRRRLSSMIFLVVWKFPAQSPSHEEVQVCRILPWIYEEKHQEKHLSPAMPWTEKQCFAVPPSLMLAHEKNYIVY